MAENAADKDRAERAEALIAHMKKARGYIYPEWEFAARQDPDFVDAYNRIYELGLGEGRHVSAKVREFIAIALLAFRGSEKTALVAHMWGFTALNTVGAVLVLGPLAVTLLRRPILAPLPTSRG